MLNRVDAIIRADRRIQHDNWLYILDKHWKCVFNYLDSWIFESLLKVGSTKSHSKPQDPEENNFF
jgi:hypothetical protein